MWENIKRNAVTILLEILCYITKHWRKIFFVKFDKQWKLIGYGAGIKEITF